MMPILSYCEQHQDDNKQLYFYYMQAFYNQGGDLIAFHNQNMILQPDSFDVLGLVLGNCIFNKNAEIIGKLFQQKVYQLSGEMIAYQPEETLPVPENFVLTNSLQQAWRILMGIKNHDSPWVNPNGKWSKKKFTDFLQ